MQKQKNKKFCFSAEEIIIFLPILLLVIAGVLVMCGDVCKIDFGSYFYGDSQLSQEKQEEVNDKEIDIATIDGLVNGFILNDYSDTYLYNSKGENIKYLGEEYDIANDGNFRRFGDSVYYCDDNGISFIDNSYNINYLGDFNSCDYVVDPKSEKIIYVVGGKNSNGLYGNKMYLSDFNGENKKLLLEIELESSISGDYKYISPLSFFADRNELFYEEMWTSFGGGGYWYGIVGDIYKLDLNTGKTVRMDDIVNSDLLNKEELHGNYISFSSDHKYITKEGADSMILVDLINRKYNIYPTGLEDRRAVNAKFSPDNKYLAYNEFEDYRGTDKISPLGEMIYYPSMSILDINSGEIKKTDNSVELIGWVNDDYLLAKYNDGEYTDDISLLLVSKDSGEVVDFMDFDENRFKNFF